MRLLTKMQAASSVRVNETIRRIDKALGGDLSSEALRGYKDELLVLLADEPAATAQLTPRIARLNLRLKSAAESGDLGASEILQREAWSKLFFQAAKRLLDPNTFDILCREANARRDEAQAARSVVQPPPKSAPKPVVVSQNPKPAPPPPLVARVHELVSSATNRPLKFDPTRLFREFGRDRVLGVWNLLPAEKRPETANEFRNLLLAHAHGVKLS